MKSCRKSSRGQAALVIVTLLAAALATTSVLAFIYRQDLREAYRRWQEGPLPAELSYEQTKQLAPPANQAGGVTERRRGGEAGEPKTPAGVATAGGETSGQSDEETERRRDGVTGEAGTLVGNTNSKSVAAPAAETGPTTSTAAETAPPDAPLPIQINLAVPMIYQSPFQVWDAVDEDACEEASILMVQAFYRGETSLTREEMRRRLDEVIAYEKRTLGFFESTTAAETVGIMTQFLGLRNVHVLPVTSPDDIRRELAAGRPIILPCDGRLLLNPNFRNGGPLYHMLVVKGYKPAAPGQPGWFITQDPGTRKGEDYLYDADVLVNAIHDWNGGDVQNGAKVMITME